MQLPWRRLEGRIQAIEEAMEALSRAERLPYDDGPILEAIQDLDERLRAQTMAIAEGIERVDRSERRVRAVVQRAQKRLEEAGFGDEGLEAEASQLRIDYGEPSPGSGMPPVRTDMGYRADMEWPEESLPGGWTAEDRALIARRQRN